MGKKKSSRSSSRIQDEYSDEDSASTASTSNSVDIPLAASDVDDQDDMAGVLDGYMDALYEKRSSVREAALRGLISAMKGHVLQDFANERQDSLCQSLQPCLRKGRAEEQALAAKALALLSFSTGGGDSSDEILQEAGATLVRILKTATSGSARLAAAECLSMLVLASSSGSSSSAYAPPLAHRHNGVEQEEDEGASSVEGAVAATEAALWDVARYSLSRSSGGAAGKQRTSGLSAPTHSVSASSLSAWALLLSLGLARPPSDSLPSLTRLLQDPEAGVRRAAGEAVALIHEKGGYGDIAEEDWGEAEGDDSSSRDSGDPSSSSDTDESYIDGMLPEDVAFADASGQLAGAVSQMRALSVQANKRQSKKEKQKSQKANLRHLSASIQLSNLSEHPFGECFLPRYNKPASFILLHDSLQSGSCPETTLKLKYGDSLRISTWAKTIQLQAVRSFLADGLQRHLQENPLLHHLFDFSPREEKMEGFRSSVEKRLMQSPNSVASKSRSQGRKQSRNRSQAYNMGHFSVTEED